MPLPCLKCPCTQWERIYCLYLLLATISTVCRIALKSVRLSWIQSIACWSLLRHTCCYVWQNQLIVCSAWECKGSIAHLYSWIKDGICMYEYVPVLFWWCAMCWWMGYSQATESLGLFPLKAVNYYHTYPKVWAMAYLMHKNKPVSYSWGTRHSFSGHKKGVSKMHSCHHDCSEHLFL